MKWVLRGIAAIALMVTISQTTALVIDEMAVVPTPTPVPSIAEPSSTQLPEPPADPSVDSPPSAEPSVQLPVATPTPVIVSPPIVRPPAPTPAPTPVPPPVRPTCVAPGHSGGGNHVGWANQGRECAGKPAGGIIVVLPFATVAAAALSVLRRRRS